MMCQLPYQTQVKALPNPSQTGKYSIYLPRRDGRSWPMWSLTRPQTVSHL